MFTDNFYTKPKLAMHLRSEKTKLTGTVRVNSKDFPADLVKMKLAVGQSVFRRKGPMLAIAFCEKQSQRRPVLMLSTAHKANIETKTIRGKELTKPSMVFDYNTYMGGIDLSDKIICHYAAERPTRRYWKKIFFNLVDICLLNSYTLYRMSPNTKKLFRQDYIICVLEALCEPHAQPAAHPVRPPPQPHAAVPTHHLSLLDGKKEKDCYVCSDRSRAGGRKRSRHWCPLCEVGCHELCQPQLTHTTGLGRHKKRRRM